MSRKAVIYFALLAMFSCSSPRPQPGGGLITVSIAPFKFLIEKIGGEDFAVNIMVPSGADPHMYEPSPGQVSALRKSSAYISDGYLDFEITWLDRFYSVNPQMIKLRLADSLDLLSGDEDHQSADPHFWLSPVEALKIAGMVKNLLCRLNPTECLKYTENYNALADSIEKIHARAGELLKPFAGQTIVTFHHTLGYFARDYNLKHVSIEHEGKEPSPSWLKEVTDEVKRNNIRAIIVQREFDVRTAKVIAAETGAELKYIETLSADWFGSVNGIIDAVYACFER